MPGDSKEIRISLKIDEQALQRMRTALSDVTRDMQAFVNASKGLTAGSGGAAPVITTTGRVTNEQQAIAAIKGAGNAGGSVNPGNALAASFTESAQAMKNLSGISRDTMRVMSDVVSRATREQGQAIAALDKQISDLTDSYTGLAAASAKSGNPYSAAKAEVSGGLASAVGERQKASSNLVNLEQQQKAIQNTLSPAQKGGYYDDTGNWVEGPGGGPGGGPRMPKYTGLGPSTGKGWLAAGGTALAVANWGINEQMAGGRAYGGLMGEQGRFVRGEMEKLRGGDLSLMYGLKKVTEDPEGRVDQLAQTEGWGATAEQGAAGVKQAAKSITGLGETGPGGTFGAFTGIKQDTNMARNAVMVARDYAAAHAQESMALDDFTASMPSRVAAQRLGLASGTGAVVGKGGVKEGVNSYGDTQFKLKERGLDWGALQSAQSSLIGIGGKSWGAKNAWTVMEANAGGYGGYGELLGAQARTGSSSGVLNMQNTAAALQLGRGVTGSGFDVRGNISADALLSSFQAGSGTNGPFQTNGGIGDFNSVARFQAGAGGLDRALTGQIDAFQQGRNIMGAINAAPNAGVYGQDFLTTMDAKTAAGIAYGGQSTAASRAHGTTAEQAKSYLDSMDKTMMARFVDQSGANDPMSNEMRKLKASGKNVHDYIGGIKGAKARESAIENIGVFAGEHGYGGAEAGIGAIGIEAGLDEKSVKRLQTKKGIGGGPKGAEADFLKAQAEMEKKLVEALKEIAGKGSGLGGLSEGLAKVNASLASFNDGTKSAEQLNRSFLALGDTLDKLNVHLGGTAPKHPAMEGKKKEQKAAALHTVGHSF